MTATPAQKEIDWLYSTQLFGIKLGLENVQRLLGELRLPQAGQQFIHVAGTNGKGSTCAFMHAVLKAAGIQAGLFTSPHLIQFGERIRDTRRMISTNEIAQGIQGLRERVQGWEPHPTFFELTLALALEWFAAQACPWVVLETGLGGRLDATNAVTPAVSVITPIGWDHMDLLGDTLGKIAAEKAGIIKPGVPVVTGPQEPEALEVIQRTAAERGAPLVIVNEPVTELALGLLGPHQRWNAALALAALKPAGFDLAPEVVAAGLRQVDWPARFQRVQPDLVVDGAHNEDAARVLVQTWREAFPATKARVIFGGVAGKDTRKVLRELLPIVERVAFTAIDSPRTLSAAQLAEVWHALAGEACAVTQHASLSEALQAREEGMPTLITGSLYLAGEALALLQPEGAAFERSAQ